MTFKFRPLLLIYAVVIGTPLLFTLTYLLAASMGHVPWCFPPIQGCIEITRTGLKPPESYLFRFGLMPIATLMGLLFYFFMEWLERLNNGYSRRARISWYFAFSSSICLLASTALIQGTKDTAWDWHVVFATLFFLLMLVAQVLYTLEDNKLRNIKVTLALRIRVTTNIVQFLLLIVGAIQWAVTGTIPNPSYEWLITFSYIAWFASFIFEKEDLFVLDDRKVPGS